MLEYVIDTTPEPIPWEPPADWFISDKDYESPTLEAIRLHSNPKEKQP